MEFAEPLVEGRLIRRYKRFLADVRLADGNEIVAHCANPGSMKTCLAPEAPVWLSRSDNPRRKLPYTLELIEVDGVLIFINPVRANRVVEEGLERGRVAELCGYEHIEREVGYGLPVELGATRSRADFRLRAPGRSDCYVEVKNVTLSLGSGRAAFPDAVTARGARHLRELERVSARGDRAVLVYCVSRSDAVSVEAAVEIDPEYARAFEHARHAGVEVLAHACDLTTSHVRLGAALPVCGGTSPALAVSEV